MSTNIGVHALEDSHGQLAGAYAFVAVSSDVSAIFGDVLYAEQVAERLPVEADLNHDTVRQCVSKNSVRQILLVVALQFLQICHAAKISLPKESRENRRGNSPYSEQRRVSLPSPTVNSAVSLLSPSGRDGYSCS